MGATKMFLWQVSNQSIKVKRNPLEIKKMILRKCSKRAGENSFITTRPKRILDEDDGIVRSHKKKLRKVSAKSRAW
jgi:hypothetical protein